MDNTILLQPNIQSIVEMEFRSARTYKTMIEFSNESNGYDFFGREKYLLRKGIQSMLFFAWDKEFFPTRSKH